MLKTKFNNPSNFSLLEIMLEELITDHYLTNKPKNQAELYI